MKMKLGQNDSTLLISMWLLIQQKYSKNKYIIWIEIRFDEIYIRINYATFDTRHMLFVFHITVYLVKVIVNACNPINIWTPLMHHQICFKNYFLNKEISSFNILKLVLKKIEKSFWKILPYY